MTEIFETTDWQSNPAFWLDVLATRIQKGVKAIEAPYDFSWKEFETLEKIGSSDRGLPLNHIVRPNPLGGKENKQGDLLLCRFQEAGFVQTEHDTEENIRVILTKEGREFVQSRQKAYTELAESLSKATSPQFIEDLKSADNALLLRSEFR